MTFESAPDSVSLFLTHAAQSNPVGAAFLVTLACAAFAAWAVKAVF